jgi:hypothetical protein
MGVIRDCGSSRASVESSMVRLPTQALMEPLQRFDGGDQLDAMIDRDEKRCKEYCNVGE